MNRRTENSQYSHTQMVMIDSNETFEREGTAELKNDPRFFTENVLDKRLAAFEALAIVTEIMSVEAIKQLFELAEEFEYVGDQRFVGLVQVVGFGIMVSVMFAATMATAVLSLQLFFTIRLMTASPTGFDKAARFYQDRQMWLWRERAIFGVKYSLVCFMLATGCMLFVKFYLQGTPEAEEHGHGEEHGHHEHGAEHGHGHHEAGHGGWHGVDEYFIHRVYALLVFVVFSILSTAMYCLIRMHQRVFDECYSSLDICHNSLNRHLVSERPERFISERSHHGGSHRQW